MTPMIESDYTSLLEAEHGQAQKEMGEFLRSEVERVMHELAEINNKEHLFSAHYLEKIREELEKTGTVKIDEPDFVIQRNIHNGFDFTRKHQEQRAA